MAIPDTFQSVEQAAKCLGLSPQRVRVLLAKRKLQGYQHITEGGRVTWRVHTSLKRRHGVAGRPRKKHRRAVSQYGGSEAKPC